MKEGDGWKKVGDGRMGDVDKFVERVMTCTESAFFNSGSHVCFYSKYGVRSQSPGQNPPVKLISKSPGQNLPVKIPLLKSPC